MNARGLRVLVPLGLAAVGAVWCWGWAALGAAVVACGLLAWLAAIGGGLAWRAAGVLFRRVRGAQLGRIAAAALVVAATAVNGATGLATSHQRVMHNVFANSTFDTAVDVPRLRFLRWGTPTEIKGGRVSAAELAKLCSYLERRGAFFVFPEFTILYGVLGVSSPQPLLWFHPGLTYPHGGDPALDRRIVVSLQDHGVDTVVIERKSWIGKGEILEDFPKLREWIDSGFQRVGSIGIFDLYERRAVPYVTG